MVNGTEVTLAEFNEEARSRGLAVARDSGLRDALLKELVERKLLVEQARAQKLDETPQYLLASRRLTEIALAQQLVADTAAEGHTISEEDVRRFIADTPQAFERRTSITIDEIVSAKPMPPNVSRALKEAGSVEAMEALLARAAIQARRVKVTVDSATLIGTSAALLSALSPGQTFALDDGSLAGQVVAVLPQPVPPEQRATLAREVLSRRSQEQALAALLASVKPGARIQYKRGFAPPGASQN